MNSTDYTIDEQLELYKAMLGAQPQSMFLINKDKIIIGIFNASPESLAGHSVEDLIGHSILKFANDPSSPFCQACTMLNSTFDPVYKTGIPLKFQYMILDNYLEATVVKISGERILSQVRDITDIVLKIKDIENKKRNELSIALIAGGLTSWSYDVEKQLLSSSHENKIINAATTLDEMLALILPEHRAATVKMFDDIISRKCEHAHITVQLYNRDGVLVWSDVHAVPHEFSPEGKVTLIIGSQKDVTQEHEHNNKLKELNKQNELILNNNNSGFVYLTSELTVEWENVSKVFTDPEIIGSFQEGKIFKAVRDEQEDFYLSAILQAYETQKQTISKKKVKSGIIVESIAQPIFSENNTFEGIVIRIDDITSREQSIYELAEAKEKAEQSDKLKSSFLANMSHEIRTPLNSIVGFSQLLPEIESKEEQAGYIHIIESNTKILLNLINDILDLSKIEAGYFSYNNSVFDLSELFYELTMTFKDKIQSNIEFSCDIPESKFTVNLDRIRISQIVTNFLTNALKFTREGHIKFGFIAMAEYVKLYVEDTGCGMSSQQLEHVFDRFEKLNSFEQGTGLGTSITKAIVDAYDGKIGVESTVGSGSTFWAILPTNIALDETEKYILEKEQTARTNVVLSKEDISQFRILIAEDNDSNYKLIEILLKGYPIKRASNGVEAVELVKNELFDLVLMDIRMPLMDGVEATLQIRKFSPSLPIIALTANAFDDDRKRAHDAGVNSFLTKPLNSKKLWETIERYCNQK